MRGEAEATMSIVIPQTVAARPTAHAALERDLRALAEKKQAWAELPVGQKAELLERVKRETARAASAWVEAAVRAKGIPESPPLAGGEWTPGPWALLYGLNRHIEALRANEKHGRLRIPKRASPAAKN